MISKAPATASEDLLAAKLRTVGITEAVIIDDTFDAPSREDLLSEISDFWSVIEPNESLLAKLAELKPGLREPADFDDELLRKLWDSRDDLPELALPLQQELFPRKIEGLAALKLLSGHLERIGVKPVLIGSQQELPEHVRLVFLDYRLGLGTSGAAVEAAKSMARKIYTTYVDDADKPFVVLMSSHSEAGMVKEDFREAAGLLGGLFGYVSKEELQNREKLYLYLATWAIGIPSRYAIQHFVEALEAALGDVTVAFKRSIRSLGFEDYANIQWLSLRSDGHPLGDYMLWLYKSLLIHLFRQNPKVLDQQKKLDAISFEKFTPSQSPPSPKLAEIYRCALTEPAVSDSLANPRAPKEGTPLLELGDLFFKNKGADVLVVINAACDLTYSPGSSRTFPKDRCILLLHGKLHPHETVKSSAVIQTELFEYKGKPYRILWDQRDVSSVSYDAVEAWLASEGYKREGRLALPYALQVQQAFAMNLMRIGTPIGPPICERANVELLYRGGSGNWTVAGGPIPGAVLIIRQQAGKDETLFALAPDCIGLIVDNIDVAIASLQEQKRQLEAKLAGLGAKDERAVAEVGGKIKGAEGNLLKLTQLKDLSWWLRIVEKPISLPEVGDCREFDAKLLRICHQADLSDIETSGPPIRLNIRSAASPTIDLAPTLSAEDTPTDEVLQE